MIVLAKKHKIHGNGELDHQRKRSLVDIEHDAVEPAELEGQEVGTKARGELVLDKDCHPGPLLSREPVVVQRNQIVFVESESDNGVVVSGRGGDVLGGVGSG